MPFPYSTPPFNPQAQAPGYPMGDPGVTGLPGNEPEKEGILQRIIGALGGNAPAGGLLDPAARKGIQNQYLLNLGAGLLAGSGSGQRFGAILGQSLQGAQQAKAQAINDQIREMLLMAQIKKSQQPEQTAAIQEYEYAKANGYQGSFEEWKQSGGGMGAQQDPAAIQEFNFYSKLTPEQQKQFLQIKRGQVAGTVAQIEGAPVLVNRVTGETQQLSSPDAERAAASELERSKVTGRATGEAEGAKQAKAVGAQGVIDLLDQANVLIDESTGSIGGTIIDKGAAAVGKSTKGAEAIASLKTIQAGLVQAMPRLEGPQSDSDRKLYIEAAGQIADSTLPRETRKAGIRTLRRIQEKYQSAAGQPSPTGGGASSARKYNPATGRIE